MTSLGRDKCTRDPEIELLDTFTVKCMKALAQVDKDYKLQWIMDALSSAEVGGHEPLWEKLLLKLV